MELPAVNLKSRCSPADAYDEGKLVITMRERADAGLTVSNVEARGEGLEEFKERVMKGLGYAKSFLCSDTTTWKNVRVIAGKALEGTIKALVEFYKETYAVAELLANDLAISVGKIIVDQSRKWLCERLDA